MKLMEIPMVETVPKGLEERPEELEIRRRIENIQTTTLDRILRRVLETWQDSDSSERPLAEADVKNSQTVKWFQDII